MDRIHHQENLNSDPDNLEEDLDPRSSESNFNSQSYPNEIQEEHQNIQGSNDRQQNLEETYQRKLPLNHDGHSYYHHDGYKTTLYYYCQSRNCTGKVHLTYHENENRYEIILRYPHTCEKPQASSQNKTILASDILVTNAEITATEQKIEDLMYETPLERAKFFFEQEFNKKNDSHIISLSKIERLLSQVRSNLYPKQPEILFGGDFTKTRDDKDQQFLLCRHTLPIKNSRKNSEEVVLFASPWMLSILEKSEALFFDGTFGVSPVGYCQILILMGLHPDTNIFTPILYGLVKSKIQDVYEVFFGLLEMYAKRFSFKIKARYIVLDFEISIHNALHKIFPEMKVIPCFFHMVRNLWRHARQEKLFSDEIIKEKTKYLLSNIILIVHLEEPLQKLLWAKLVKQFESEPLFEKFMKYFYDNYLAPNSLWKKCVNYSESCSEELFVRTNNCLEAYNNRLRIMMKFKSPSLGYAITILLNEEHLYKSLSLKIISGKIPKNKSPMTLEETELKMPVNFALQQILSLFPKSEQKKLSSFIDEEEFSKMTKMTVDSLKRISDEISETIFEEDLELFNDEEQIQQGGSGTFNSGMTADQEPVSIGQRLKKAKISKSITQSPFVNPASKK